MLFLNLIKESLFFAYNSLIVNKLRTFLSLLGITIGIFAIISVFSVIDSLELNIRESIESLGDNVIYVQKWPWTFGPDYPWWKYIKRPVPELKELDEIRRRSQKIQAAAFMISTQKTVQYGNNSVEDVVIIAASHDYENIRQFEIANGRYFSNLESIHGRNCVIIGNDIAETLFENQMPVGKKIKILGRKLSIIGVFTKEGEDIFSNSMDNMLLIPINYARNIIDIRNERLNPMIMIKSKEHISNDEMIDELKQIMRSIRKLKPKAEDDFALNQASMLTKGFEQVFKIIDIAGLIIGGFSILVGGFGIANIMFVSVKERTHIIGIQKSLGAKKYFILFQFLFEAIILCLIGGIIGLILIYTGTIIANNITDMSFALTLGNITSGLEISIIIGVISGFAPAYAASKLNCVDAINTTF